MVGVRVSEMVGVRVSEIVGVGLSETVGVAVLEADNVEEGVGVLVDEALAKTRSRHCVASQSPSGTLTRLNT